MPNDLDRLKLFKSGLKAQTKARASDDIVSFIKAHWSWFTWSRKHMDAVCAELEQRGPVTPTDLCDALQVPPCVVFKKAKIVDAAKVLIDAGRSDIVKAFREYVKGLAEAGRDTEVAMVVVAGSTEGRPLVITNMATEKVPGLVHLFIAGAADRPDPDIHIFPVADAPLRMPNFFNRRFDND
jgi:hypothetical protein